MSDYFKKLCSEHTDVAERYSQKLSIINNVDPYLLKDNEMSISPKDFPPVTYFDLINYLVLTTSYYTGDQMRAYKSLSAFKYFDAGFVSRIGAVTINEYIVVVGKVKHSQKMNEPPLGTWIICSKNGSVINGHCTCMAGTGEVCSHIGALLYSLEFIHKSTNTLSSTDVRSLWNVPSGSKVKCETISNINYGKRIKFVKEDEPIVETLKGEGITNFLQKIKDVGSESVLMRLIEPFASENYVEKEKIENPFNNLFNDDHQNLSYLQLIELSENIIVNMSVEECSKIEKNTKMQSCSEEWFYQRKGRVTASILKNVCHTSLEDPSLSLIKSICYPVMFSFKTKAMKWGLDHESHGLQEYLNEINTSHENVEIENAGFYVHPNFPHLGASPDGIVKCSCCGKGCVEIKCPFRLKNMSLMEFANLRGSCLMNSENNILLDMTHAYYYQIQQQMAITCLNYCDFVVWSPKQMFLQRIPFNEDFWIGAREKASTFHKRVILPELLGCYFTKAKYATWCICDGKDDGTPMINCDNDDCMIKWFHFDCIGIDEPPRHSWICNLCKELDQ